jgi:acylphosphatase
MDTESVRLHVVVSGSVQGVGFRQYVLRHANRLSVHGWVRNRWDRKVELIAEGTRQELQLLLERITEGPPASSVRNVDAEWTQPTGEFHSFEVKG